MPVNMGYIAELCEKADSASYGVGRKGLSPQEQKMRKRALISLMYLSARRVSELVGRTLKDKEALLRGKQKLSLLKSLPIKS